MRKLWKNDRTMEKLFAKRIKALKSEKGCTYKELCNAIQKNIETYKNYEAAVSFPNGKTLIYLARFFNVSCDYLLCLTDERALYPAKDETSFTSPPDSAK